MITQDCKEDCADAKSYRVTWRIFSVILYVLLASVVLFNFYGLHYQNNTIAHRASGNVIAIETLERVSESLDGLSTTLEEILSIEERRDIRERELLEGRTLIIERLDRLETIILKMDE